MLVLCYFLKKLVYFFEIISILFPSIAILVCKIAFASLVSLGKMISSPVSVEMIHF